MVDFLIALDVESGRFPTPTAPDATKSPKFFRRYKEVERGTTARSRNRLVMQRTPSPQPEIGILPLMAGPPQTPSTPAGSESLWSSSLSAGNDPSPAEDGGVNPMVFFDDQAWEQSGSATLSSSPPVSTVAHSPSVPDPANYYNRPHQSDPYPSDPYDSNPYDSNPYQNNPDPPNPYYTNPYALDPNNLPYSSVLGSGRWIVPVPVRIPGQGGGQTEHEARLA